MKISFKHYSELSVDELYDILKLRSEIFVVEQNCVYNDMDDLDKLAVHLQIKNGFELIGYARLLKPGTRFSDYSIGRLVVKESERGNGIGIFAMEEAKKYMIEHWNSKIIKVSAQQYLQRFYEDLGFQVVTDVYLEDGIPHVGMSFKLT